MLNRMKKWKDKYMSFMSDRKIYKDIFHTIENANISERTISNIFKNADLEKVNYSWLYKRQK